MRLFIAAELDEALYEALSETSALLRESVRGSYVPPDSFHITLAFLGECSADSLDTLEAIVARVAHTSPAIDVQLGALGSFGRPRSAVLWQGFEPSQELERLAQTLRSELTQAGISYDKKGFLAHVSLMRKAQIEQGQLPAAQLASGTIERIALMRSHLGGARAEYETLFSAQLGSS